MTTLTLNSEPLALDVSIGENSIVVDLDDGRTLSVPIAWFPRLRKATEPQRKNWRLLGRGEGIHWPDIDEDISVLGLLAGFGDAAVGKAAAE